MSKTCKISYQTLVYSCVCVTYFKFVSIDFFKNRTSCEIFQVTFLLHIVWYHFLPQLLYFYPLLCTLRSHQSLWAYLKFPENHDSLYTAFSQLYSTFHLTHYHTVEIVTCCINPQIVNTSKTHPESTLRQVQLRVLPACFRLAVHVRAAVSVPTLPPALFINSFCVGGLLCFMTSKWPSFWKTNRELNYHQLR
jgi:hypothetical protein